MKRYGLALAAALLIFWGVMSALASPVPGTPADPLVTLSYITEKFAPMLTDEAAKLAEASLNAKNTSLNELLSGVTANKDLAEKAASAAMVSAINTRVSREFTDTGGLYKPVTVSIPSGRTLTVARGTSVVLTSGAARVYNPALNMTSGASMPPGSAVPQNQEIFFADNGGGIRFDTAASLLVCGRYALTVQAYIPKYRDLAAALNGMGLLRGTGAGYALNRPATRAEALYMMLYLMGEIDAAESYTGESPFGDVPDWARAAVAYAYDKGYTKGMSAAVFGSQLNSTPDQYVTMLLRIMGYDDSAGDFEWNRAVEFAVSKDILTAGERTALNSGFLRDQMVYVSYYALDARVKTGETFGQRLVSRGVLSESAMAAARSKVTRVRGM